MAFLSAFLFQWLTIYLCLSAAEIFSKRQLQNINNTYYDYVILGGGTAGLVIASRLTQDPNVKVLVVEAGDFQRNNPNVTSSTALGAAKDTQLDWQYASNTGPYGANRTLVWSAGKGLGGSSLINGMTYTRPASSQIDLWPSLGIELNWNTLFNFAKKGEHFQLPQPNITALGAAYDGYAHGFNGPLATCVSPHITNGSIHNTLNSTFKALGVPSRDEFNGGELHGFGIQQVTQDGIADVREDAARAYYYPFMNRTNLIVAINTTATRILWIPTNSNGSLIAAAVEVVSQNGTVSTVFANREIILSAGAFRSPAILENSGVGNPSIITKQSIDLKVNLSAVGENLQDQTTIPILAALINQNSTGFPGFVAYISFQDLFGSNASSIYNSTLAKLPQYAAAIAAQNGGASSVAVQQRLLKSQLDLLYNSNTPASEMAPIVLGNSTYVVFWPLQPLSRGSVHINSTNMTTQPVIQPNFFQFDFDGKMAVQTSRFVRKLLMTAPLSSFVNASSITPGFDIVPEDASDSVWLDWIQSKSAYQPNYHHLGTCAMLPRNMGGVVDNNFRVYGTKNVRVVDLSVVPLQVAGHSTAVLYGIAEWAAQKIRDGT